MRESLKNLQPDNLVGKKTHFLGTNSSKEEQKVNSQKNGENASRHFRDLHGSLFHHSPGGLGGKKWFHGPGPGSRCSGQPLDMVPSIVAASAPAVAKRGQGTAWTVASEGANPKPWKLLCGVGPAAVQKTKIELWEPLPRFQKMYENAWMTRQKSAAGVEPSWRTSTRAVWTGNVGLEPPYIVPTEALPSAALRRLPSSRPQDSRSTDSLCCATGKAAGTQCQPVKAAMRAIPCRADGAELHKALGAHPLSHCGLDVRQLIGRTDLPCLR
ncbi:uncharacterized protein LOC111526523 isoform X1 [Piliocolobus tephrosceles]|uniref:uncharacterized protein LOC111526523 isoform X1 n=1 Tax=Piliocolobus tephrosceles TaxID=591936 RepID=UPI000C2ACAD1|nr:uncharacterized protein LOC111526523 isoform X1 [Piliocolobus tephrosceles]